MRKLSKVLFLILLLSAIRYPLNATYAAVPHLINYQGRLTDSSGTPLNGSYNLTFRIYDAETAGNLLWEETHAGALIQKGIFSVLLGSVTNLNLAFDKPYFLEIKVNNEVMSPRQRIAASAYAMRAENVDSLPRGIITMWSGRITDIPSGWALCDGTNGAPDLRDRFIVGARQDDSAVAKTNVTGSLTQSGGSTTISIDNLPAHVHGAGTISTNISGSHAHTYNDGQWLGSYEDPGIGYTSGGSRVIIPASDAVAGGHPHVISGSTASTGSGNIYLPPYYALIYIVKL